MAHVSRHLPQPAVQVVVTPERLHAHLYSVSLSIFQPAADQVLELAAWIPGSYLVREFAKHLQGLHAFQGGRAVPLTQTHKSQWVAHCKANQPMELRYEVYAFDNSVRTAWLDTQRGFFNSTSLVLRVVGQTHLPHYLHIQAPSAQPDWQLATGLTPVQVDPRGFGIYSACDYDALVDAPVEMGDFWSGEFEAAGVPHRFVVAGAPPSFDGKQLLEDTRKICEVEHAFWHGADAKAAAPFARYVFMLNAVADGYGGLEHHNSTALIAAHKDLPRLPGRPLTPPTHKHPEGYTTLLGLISHEYFHAWNVKQLRPRSFHTYDYAAENYTELLWFFEGFTSYYDDLLLRRAHVLDNTAYFKLLAKTINQVRQTPGAAVQSVAQASFDAWIKYYRQDENTPNATVSYYSKGALVALCLDLTLRSEGHATLDDVMRALWHRCRDTGLEESDVLAVLEQLGRRPYAAELHAWVHGTQPLPVESLLAQHGIQVHMEPDAIAQQLGLRVKESAGSVQVQNVLRGSPAEAAGFASGDEWLAVQIDAEDLARPGSGSTSGVQTTQWRLHTLDDLPLYLGRANRLLALVARDRRLLALTVDIPPASQSMRLSVQDSAAVARWLDPTS